MTDRLVERLRAAGCVVAEDEAAVLRDAAAGDDIRLERMTWRRVAGEPLEHVVGWAGFAGLRVPVRPPVFVPRRRSEFLVAEAIARTPERGAVLDLCCGTGAIGLAIRAARPGIELHAADLDPDAVACARENLAGAGDVHEGDLFDALPRGLAGRFDVIAVNAPYVPTDELALLPGEARDHEARIALDGGADGLDLHRRIAAGCGMWLAPGGVLLIETAEHQARAVARMFAVAGFGDAIARDDDADATVVIAAAPAAPPGRTPR